MSSTVEAQTHDRTADHTSFVADWNAWQEQRFAAVSADYGTAALAATIWLSDAPAEHTELPGLWSRRGDTLVGVQTDPAEYSERRQGTSDWGPLTAPSGEVELRPGLELKHGDRIFRHYDRGSGDIALRVIDPATPRRVSLVGIDAYEPNPDYVVTGQFVPAAEHSTVTVQAVDGKESTGVLAGVINLELSGQAVSFTITESSYGISVVFSDATLAEGGYRFRFLSIDQPREDGSVVVDFNRAYLPPCAFSDHYVCPLPLPGNRWDVPVRAGEKSAKHRAPEAG